MREPYRKGLANHPGPESCADSGNAAGEALTGETQAWRLSSEIRAPGSRPCCISGKAMLEACDTGEHPPIPAESKTQSMCGHSSRGNRESPETSGRNSRPDRSGKVKDRAPDTHVSGQSHGGIVPANQPNRGGPYPPPEEAGEGRPTNQGEHGQSAADRTLSRVTTDAGLLRVREAARRDKRMKFTALLHHISVELLRESFFALKRQAAPGVDGVTWAAYEDGVEDRLRDLHGRVHRGAYRAQPSKRAYIPKADGKQRPLGIAALEDKIVQQAVVTVLNQIYETDFKGFSYGFRPGRSQHQALDALWVGLTEKPVNWVLDADLQQFFDSISHEWLLRFLEHRVADKRMLRLIAKWLRAGVSEDGQWSETKEGTPQGAVISPLLANVFLHYAFDLWADHWREHQTHGTVIIVRYADDFVVGFQSKTEAERFLADLRVRLEGFGLRLHPEKTRLIEFGRYATRNRQASGEGRPESFNFLGFTHCCAVTRTNKKFTVYRQSIGKRLRAKLAELKDEIYRRRHEAIDKVGRWLRSVVQGWFNYHAVPCNGDALETFRQEIVRAWLHALRRRGQKHRMTWDRFAKIHRHWIPSVRILHPYPAVRFHVRYPR